MTSGHFMGMYSVLFAAGVLSGTLLDPMGQPVRGARVEAVHLESSAPAAARSDDLGAFVFTGLRSGRHVLRVEWTGFKPLVTAPIEVGAETPVPVSLTLELDGHEEQVSVRFEAPVLQTDSAVVGQVITGSTASVLPMTGRNLAQLALLLPGVVTTAPASLAQPKLDAEGRPYVNGHREQGNSFVLDGVDGNEPLKSTHPYQPGLEAVEEVRFETNNYSAAYGNVAGAMIQVTVKSGTRRLRGSLFAMTRPPGLSAGRWEQRSTSAPLPRVRQYNFGATLGGPLWPEKVFFFADYEGYSKHETATSTSLVPSLKWRAGDFSDLTVASRPLRLRDPAIQNAPGRPFVDPYFAGNRIPGSRIDPTAAALLADQRLYPLPNTGTNGFRHQVRRPVDHRQGDVKLTAQPGPRDNLSLRVSLRESTSSARSLDWMAYGGVRTRSPFRSTALHWNRTFGIGGVSQLQLGYSRLFELTEDAVDAGLGDVNVAIGLDGAQSRPGLSAFRITGLSTVGSPAASNATTERLYFASEQVSILRGRHQLKAGGDWLHARIQSRRTGAGGLLGYYSFEGRYTLHPFADFLLGYVGTKKKVSDWREWEERQHRLGLFVEDVFRPSPRLTATLGLRWSYYSPWVEVEDRQVNFDLVTGERRFAGVDGHNRGLYDSYHRGFEPRLGLAWTVRDGLVLRAGYGIVQSMEGIPPQRRLTQNPPFFAERVRVYDYPERGRFGFDDTRVQEAQVAGTVNAYDPQLKPQWTQQWNVFLERAFSRTLTLNVGYVGHRARRLLVPRDFNQAAPGDGPYSSSTWKPLQQRRPFYSRWPDLGTLAVTTSTGRSRYDSLQVVLRQRPAHGLELTGSYTWARAFTHNVQHAAGGSAWTPRSNVFAYARALDAEYGPAWFDVTHNLAVSGTYQPRFGRGLTLSTVFLWHGGFPLTVYDSRRRSQQTTDGFELPNRVGSGRIDHPTPERWIDIGAFEEAAEGTFGDSGAGILRGPPYSTWNLGLSRLFSLPARARLILRVQVFNLLDHTNFGLPARDLASPTTFGRITTTVDHPRQVEVGAKIEW